jgi:hypothetical protein
MDVDQQRQVHAFTGLFPGDYFVHEFDFDGQRFFAYGLVRHIDEGARASSAIFRSMSTIRPRLSVLELS